MSENQRPALPAATLAFRVLAPFAAGYFLSYLYRSVNAILGPEIVKTIHLDAAALGLMTGAYFLAFGAFQPPLGILLDRFGPRRVEAALLLFAATGAAAFSLADGGAVLIAGRALVGLGVSACLMAALKANVQWFPSGKLPLMNGIVLSAGGLGAVAATAPVQAALAVTDWRGVYALLAVVTVAVAVVLFLAVPDRDYPPHAVSGNPAGQLEEIAAIVRHPLFLKVAPVFMVALGSHMAIQGLWAGPWLRDVAGMSPAGTAAGLTVMAAGMAVGFLAMGAIAERLGRMGIPIVRVAAAGMAAYWVASLLMAWGWTGAPLLLCAVYGFAGASASLNYAVLTQGFPARLAGRVNTSANLCIFVTAFVMQWGLGAIIGLWPKGDVGWPVEAYQVAFGVPVALTAITFVWFMGAGSTSPAAPR